MNNIKNCFSIKDLENLSGIKAHTIRIWEKRYKLLEPNRSDTNIRKYDIRNLQKLLNVTYLVNSGYKISKVSKLKKEEIEQYINKIYSSESIKDKAVKDFKLAMIQYDVMAFHKTYNQLAETKDFETIFITIFIPLLQEIGLLWQTNTIRPSHEHFLSTLIKQKIQVNIERCQLKVVSKKNKLPVFVLFLPENEIHDLGLLYIHYLLLKESFTTVYIGTSVPLNDLPPLKELYETVIFLSYFTIQPAPKNVGPYLHDFKELFGTESNVKLWAFGRQLKNVAGPITDNHTHFSSILELKNALYELQS